MEYEVVSTIDEDIKKLNCQKRKEIIIYSCIAILIIIISLSIFIFVNNGQQFAIYIFLTLVPVYALYIYFSITTANTEIQKLKEKKEKSLQKE